MPIPSTPFLPSGAHTTPGKPSYQQDRHLVLHNPSSTLYLVADGHGAPDTGHLVAEHCVRHLPRLLHQRAILSSPHAPHALSSLRDAIAQLDKEVIHATSKLRVYAGSTLCLVIHSKRHLVVANVGDSRAILVGRRSVRVLTVDHSCNDPRERARIEKAGGWVVGGLLNGHISMSRALGDDDLKGHRNLTPFTTVDGRGSKGRRFAENLFTGEPDVTRCEVGEEEFATVVASDGVWGKLSNEAVADVVREVLGKGRSCEDAARAVVRKAMGRGSRDNVTCVVGMVRDGVCEVTSKERRLGRKEVVLKETEDVQGLKWEGGKERRAGLMGGGAFRRRERSGLWGLRRGLGAK